MNTHKAPREVTGFTVKAGEQLKTAIAPKNYNHRAEVQGIEGDKAILNIHKFKAGKGRPAKDFTAIITVTRTHGGKIAEFKDYRVIQ